MFTERSRTHYYLRRKDLGETRADVSSSRIFGGSPTGETMWSILSGAIQVIAIVLAASLTCLGTFYKHDDGPLKRSDKVALVSVIVAAILSLTGLGIQAILKSAQHAEELTRLSNEVAQQNELLTQVTRDVYKISKVNLSIVFSVSADRKELAETVMYWDSLIASKHQKSLDGVKGVEWDTMWNGHQGGALIMSPESDLLPASGEANRILLPALDVLILRSGTPDAAILAARPHGLDVNGPFVDTRFFIALPMALSYRTNPLSGRQERGLPNMAVQVTYVPGERKIRIWVKEGSAARLGDTGRVMALTDLPGRQLVIAGLSIDDKSSLSNVEFSAITTNDRIFSDTKALTTNDFDFFKNDDTGFASYRFKHEDFSALAGAPIP